jgi:hypothetical protein
MNENNKKDNDINEKMIYVKEKSPDTHSYKG